MNILRVFGFVLFLMVVPVAYVATVLGDWRTPSDSIVRIHGCGIEVCLTVVRLDPSAPEATDQQNPDAALRGRRLCNLTVGAGFHQDDAMHLSGGHLYDPKSGRTYRGTIVADGNTLRLHGYIGISLFGRTEVWQRVAPVEACR